MSASLAYLHNAGPVAVAAVALLALQVSVLVLTTGIFVTTMLAANETLSLLRRRLRDTSRICGALEAFIDEMKTGAAT